MTIYIPILSDTHSGSRVGLMNPNTLLLREDENGEPELYQPNMTASQAYLWRLNLHALKWMQGKTVPLVIHTGDITHGNKHPAELVSQRLDDQPTIAVMALKAWFMLPGVQNGLLAYGTEAHNYGLGASDRMVAKLLTDETGVPVEPAAHPLITVDGVGIDLAHHGPHPGGRVWLMGNTARFYLRDFMIQEIEAHRIPPRLLIRAHYHTKVIETVNEGGYTSTIILMPSMCMMDDFSRQATRSKHNVTNVYIILDIDNGRLVQIHELTQTLDTRRKVNYVYNTNP